jgi:signal transduction histidine kinase/ligand-binding sensor domain-containing protein
MRRQLGVITRITVLAGCLLAWCPSAFALNPALDVSQYAHTAWKIRDGFSKGVINAIAQTADGYLWLGTELGLLRFDGVRTVPWQPPPDHQLQSSQINRLLVGRDGTLWIGTSKGLTSWKGSRLTGYPDLAGRSIFALLEDREGTVWVGTGEIPNARLCAIRNGAIRCSGGDGTLGSRVYELYQDRRGRLWVGVQTGLWQWKPGLPKFYSIPDVPNGIQGLGEDDNGALLIGVGKGVRRFVDGTVDAYPLPVSAGESYVLKMLRDRDGGLWIATIGRGLVHVHEGRADIFNASDGLSADDVSGSLFEDREGNIWVPTLDGLDRFREFSVTTYSANRVNSVLAARDGSVWVGTHSGLIRLNHGQIATARIGVANTNRALDGQVVQSLFEDGRGRIWVSTRGGVGCLANGRFAAVSGVPGIQVHALAEDKAGNLWIANQENGVFRVSARNEIYQIPWSTLGHDDPAVALVPDPSGGGLWLGFVLGGVAHVADGRIRASYAATDGLGDGTVNGLRFDSQGTLWAPTEGGLGRVKNGRVATLTRRNGLPCDAVHWALEDDVGAFWLYMPCGLVRVARDEIDAWAAAVDSNSNPKRMIQVTVFDGSDGVRTRARAGSYNPQAAMAPDGKLWFNAIDGVSVIDPRHLRFNRLPPPVHVEQITADRKTYDAVDSSGQLPLPALTRDLEIDYTALSLVAPEKNRFRYKLEGYDRDWQDVGNRRQAFYTNLPPRNYRFRVTASNNSGVWNEAGASLDFSIAPAYYQTTWFRATLVVAALALFWTLHRFRLRRLAHEFDARLQERVNERTRIARDLHDTLLQSFHGLLFRLQAASNMLPERPADAKRNLDTAIEQGSQAITEGRDAVQNLRASTVVTNDLAVAISTLGEELAAAHTNEANTSPTTVDVAVEGETRDLHPILRDDIYRIAGEALRNAFRHAQAHHIEVEIRYDDAQMQVRVRDDGKGIDPAVLLEQRPGHFGLPGMRERADVIGGHLDVWSQVGLGTEVELTIPAVAAYARPRATGWSRWFAGRTGTSS